MLKKKRNKFSIDDKELAVLNVIEKGCSYHSVARDLHTSHRLIRLWVNLYRQHGKKGLSLSNKVKYTGEYKLEFFISKDKNFYSVPCKYVDKKVSIIMTENNIEIYYNYSRIAIHKRNITPYKNITEKEHRFVEEMNADKILKMNSEIGSFTNRYVKVILDKHTYQEINYKSCWGFINLSKKVGNLRLEMACKRAISFNAYSYKVIKNILEKNLDQFGSKQDINIYTRT